MYSALRTSSSNITRFRPRRGFLLRAADTGPLFGVAAGYVLSEGAVRLLMGRRRGRALSIQECQ